MNRARWPSRWMPWTWKAEKSISWFKDTADGKGFVTEEGQVEAGSANTVDCLPRGGFVAVVK